MSKCTRCGEDAYRARICLSCLDKWANMRSQIFAALQQTCGKLSPQNHHDFIRETKRLESIWKKDVGKFESEIKLIIGKV